MSFVRAAVVGGGVIGGVHADSYRHAGAEVVAIVDPIETAGVAAAERYEAAWYSSLDDLLASDDRPDLLSICTPPSLHLSLTAAALDAGVHVLCEKPMAHSLEHARDIHERARHAAARSVIFGTAYCHRFQPEIEYISSQLQAGAIGEVRTFRNEFSGMQADIENRWFGKKAVAGGGVLLDTAIHSIDLFRFLCGEVVDVAATMSSELDGRELEVEHTALLALKSNAGVIGAIDCSWKSPTGRAVVEVAGSHGALRFDYTTPGVVTHIDETGVAHMVQVADSGARFDRQIADFMARVAAGRPSRTGSWDGYVGVAVVDAAYRRDVSGWSLDGESAKS
jgi:predicted dehydrogenase